MFKRTEFVFSEPFCSCEKENWKWNLTMSEGPNKGLVFNCVSCKTVLKVTVEYFSNHVLGVFETPWPKPWHNRVKSTSQLLEDGPQRAIEVGDDKKSNASTD